MKSQAIYWELSNTVVYDYAILILIYTLYKNCIYIYIYIYSKVKLVTVVEGHQKGPLSNSYYIEL